MSRQDSSAIAAGDWVIQSVKRNPEGLLLLAAGAALLMRQGGVSAGGRSRSSGANAVASAGNDLQDAAASAGSDLKNAANAVGGRVSEAMSSATDAAADLAGQTREKLAGATDRLAQSAKSGFQKSSERVLQEQPLAIALAGLAAGAVVAAAFPATQLEQETLGPLGDRLTEAAKDTGQRLKEAAAAAGETLTQAAEERGLNMEGAQEVAKEAGKAFKETLTRKEDAGPAYAPNEK